MSEPLAETALAFCREVLGWDKAAIAPFVSGNQPMITDAMTRPRHRLRYADLNDVLAAVRTAAGNGSVKLESHTLEPFWYAEVWMETAPGVCCFRKGQARQNDPCHALLAACVAVQRRVRERGPYSPLVSASGCLPCSKRCRLAA